VFRLHTRNTKERGGDGHHESGRRHAGSTQGRSTRFNSDSLHSVGQEERRRKAHGQRSVQDDQEIQSPEQIGHTLTYNGYGREVPSQERGQVGGKTSDNTEL